MPRSFDSAVLAQASGQLVDIGPVIAAVDRALYGDNSALSEHGAGEFAELLAQFRFGERVIEIAAMAVARIGRSPAVDQGDGHARRP